MQHFAVWPEDYDATYQRALDAGFRVCQEGDLTGRGKFVYFANEDHPGRWLSFRTSPRPVSGARR